MLGYTGSLVGMPLHSSHTVQLLLNVRRNGLDFGAQLLLNLVPAAA